MLSQLHKVALDDEVAFLLSQGMEQVSTKDFASRWKDAGFTIEYSSTIKQFSRWLSGPRAGLSTPIAAIHLNIAGTSRSWAHCDNPPEIYAKVQAMRHSFFAVTRDGYIMEV